MIILRAGGETVDRCDRWLDGPKGRALRVRDPHPARQPKRGDHSGYEGCHEEAASQVFEEHKQEALQDYHVQVRVYMLR